MADATDDDSSEVSSMEMKPKRGCFARLMGWVVFLGAVGLGFAFYEMSKPQDLTDIKGYDRTTRDYLGRDIRKLLETFAEKSYPVTFTEAEINTWLAKVLRTRQGGMLAGEGKVTLDGIWVRLEKGRAELVLERKVAGKPFTTSMYVQVTVEESDNKIRREVKLHGGPFHEYLPFPKCGGRFGKLPVPQGFLVLILPSFKKLVAACPDEIALIEEHMNRVIIEDGRITFDPRETQRTVTELPF